MEHQNQISVAQSQKLFDIRGTKGDFKVNRRSFGVTLLVHANDLWTKQKFCLVGSLRYGMGCRAFLHLLWPSR